jgi:hypothetical protein
MTVAVDSSDSIEALVQAISTLTLTDKQKLLDILEQQIFEAEEDSYEEDEDTKAEIKAIKAAYEAGDYDTYDVYMENRQQVKSKNESS